jgi:hypothetical protein
MERLIFNQNISTVLKLWKYRKKLDNTIKKINPQKGDSFYLFSNMRKAYDFFYLAKELSKKYEVYYYNPNIERSRHKFTWKKPIFFRAELIRIPLKIAMGIELVYITDNQGNPCLRLDNEYLSKHNIKKYPVDKTFEDLLFDVIKKSKSSYKMVDNLIIDEGPLKSMLKTNTLKNLLENVLEIPADFAIKRHPYSSLIPYNSDYYKVFEEYEKVPDYIPAELLLNNVRKNVISMLSFALHIAAQFDHINAISLLELVDWKDKKSKEFRKNYLIEKSNNKILFPKNIEELAEILLKK